MNGTVKIIVDVLEEIVEEVEDFEIKRIQSCDPSVELSTSDFLEIIKNVIKKVKGEK